ncbi:hypothetical protein B0H17DRAFT_900929, partial [Mycena rosella]
LWMPNRLLAAMRAHGYVKGLGEKEASLREAQCTNSLDTVRGLLHSKRHLIQFRNDHLVGQSQNTRSNTLVGQVGDHIDAVTIKYRWAWKALRLLKGDVWLKKKQLRELTSKDL